MSYVAIKLSSTLIAVLWMFNYCSAQTASASVTPPPNATTGIVEAVMANGDLKPARFAQVYAIPLDSAADIKKIVGSVSSAIDSLRTAAAGQPQAASQIAEAQCVTALVAVKPTLEALRGPGSNTPPSGIVAVDADEMGEFTLRGLTDQTYTVIAIGKAGNNAGIWLVDLTFSDQANKLKLVRPVIACYDQSNLYRQ